MTEEGKAAFQVLLTTWNDMAGAVNQLTQTAGPISSSEATAL